MVRVGSANRCVLARALFPFRSIGTVSVNEAIYFLLNRGGIATHCFIYFLCCLFVCLFVNNNSRARVRSIYVVMVYFFRIFCLFVLFGNRYPLSQINVQIGG